MNLSSTDLGLAARVQNLTKTYGRGESAVRALDDVSVGIRRGQFTAITASRSRWSRTTRSRRATPIE